MNGIPLGPRRGNTFTFTGNAGESAEDLLDRLSDLITTYITSRTQYSPEPIPHKLAQGIEHQILGRPEIYFIQQYDDHQNSVGIDTYVDTSSVRPQVFEVPQYNPEGNRVGLDLHKQRNHVGSISAEFLRETHRTTNKGTLFEENTVHAQYQLKFENLDRLMDGFKYFLLWDTDQSRVA